MLKVNKVYFKKATLISGTTIKENIENFKATTSALMKS